MLGQSRDNEVTNGCKSHCLREVIHMGIKKIYFLIWIEAFLPLSNNFQKYQREIKGALYSLGEEILIRLGKS